MQLTKLVVVRMLFAGCLVMMALTSHAQSEGSIAGADENPLPKVDDQWRYALTLAAWAPASSTSAFLGSAYIGSSNSSVYQNLQNAGGFAMLTGEAHKDKWGVMADMVYWQINDGTTTTKFVTKSTSLYSGTSASTTQTILTGAGTYTVYNSPTFYVDALAGIRYISSTTTASVNTVFTIKVRSVTRTTITNINASNVDSTADLVVGFKGRARIFDSAWYIPFYLDGGKAGGAQTNTWQALTGIGRAFSWGDVSLVYRAMYFELNGADGFNKFSNYGPQLAATINF